MGAFMRLGDLQWRIDPNSVDWSFQVDTAVIDTLGGQVVQILGSTLSDLVITGDFGEDRGKSPRVSWQLAAAFHQKIKQLMDRQTLPAKTVAQSQSKGAQQKVQKTGILTDAGKIHDPLSMTYHDGVHNWTFKVLIKAFTDNDGSGSLNITNGKFAYQYQLTLFIVEADSEIVRKVASDAFLSRISDGLGWKRSTFNGPLTSQDAVAFITGNGGSVSAFLDKVLDGDPLTSTTVTTSPTSGQTIPKTKGGTGGPAKAS